VREVVEELRWDDAEIQISPAAQALTQRAKQIDRATGALDSVE